MKRQPKLICMDGRDAKVLRQKLGLTQTDFWARVGSVQTAGSRYESGRDMPTQVAWVLHIAYGPPARVQKLVDWLRQSKPD
ncbi:MAG: transcriptional regulator [Betaproteobacteria bacterium HGW-Betaproteobacteria-12]|nr:MAG: transcriptional regulator [Betaproteobacteria bacterium HGW-Betaproteobacteria-12]